MGWGVLSLGRGTAQLLKSHGQNWKPVHWPHQRTAQDGCLGLEGRAFTQERTPTHQGSFMNPSSSSPWPDGYCQGLASCPDTMLGKSQPQASGAPGRDVDQRRGGGGGGGGSVSQCPWKPAQGCFCFPCCGEERKGCAMLCLFLSGVTTTPAGAVLQPAELTTVILAG